jgi:beta-lactam-binding protein with PASTA domain
MPNLKGKTLREAFSLASQNGIMLKPNTLKGKIIWQSLKPGIKTKKNQICEVRLSI